MLPILASLIGAGAGAAGASGLAGLTGLTELLGGAAGAEAAGASGGFLSGLTDLLGGAAASATEVAGDGAATGSNMMNLLDTAGGKSKKEDKQNEALISAMSSLQSMNASHPKLNLMGRR